MNVQFGKYVLSLGRKRAEPQRVTSDSYTNILPFISVTTQRQNLPKPNAVMLRRFSNNPVVRMIVNLIEDGLLKRDWEIVSKTDQPVNINQKEIVCNILNHPNSQDDYDSFFRAILEDSLVGDCMCFEKAFAGNPQRPLWLFPVDGMTIDMVINTDEFKYAQLNGADRRYYDANRLAYIKRVNKTNTPFGLSPLETAFAYIAALTNTFEYSAEVSSNALPKYVLNIGKEAGAKIDEFRGYFINDCMGQVSLPIVATDQIQSAQISPISEDACFMGYQEFLISIIAYTFGVPSDLVGVAKSKDRSTIADKLQLFEESALKPYAKLIEKAVNRHVIEELGYDVKFRYIWAETLDDKQKRITLVTSKVTAELITLDEGRVELGYSPLNTKYSQSTISLCKALINEDHQINGFNGVGTVKDKSDSKTKKAKSDGKE